VLASPTAWMLFAAVVIVGLVLDLGVFQKKSHTPSVREALGWTMGWAAAAVGFGMWVTSQAGGEKGLEFATGYLVELALSVDNLFVFVILFRAFSVPEEHRHRVLFWGIIGAVVMRGIFVAAGSALLANFEWIIYVFGALLAYTGLKLLLKGDSHDSPEKNPLFRAFRRLVPATDGFRGKQFIVKENGKWLATPLLLVLVAIEATDLVFAVDSVPAVFAITRDPFIVYTSNIFAILGLRSMYFLLAGVLDRFWLLKPALALVLVFIGGKMLFASVFHLPIVVSLGVISSLLGGGVVLSLIVPQTKAAEPAVEPESAG
jgi:tellurite resistance protein TerC